MTATLAGVALHARRLSIEKREGVLLRVFTGLCGARAAVTAILKRSTLIHLLVAD
ncbi:hypothetical protein [Hydrogenophaga sp. 2FB]|uniref:hypothetical protein n=1 Tax=Comamonadaceae TaxID=80864 RepID=UPI001BB1252A|nr:hypothetical protein [Hydrogenophaga sp. 2FB]